MKTRIHHHHAGGILMTTLIMMMLIVAITAIAVAITTNQGRLTRRGIGLSHGIAAADSQCERVFNEWRALMESMPLGRKPTVAELATVTANFPSSIGNAHPGFASPMGTYGAFIRSSGATVSPNGTTVTEPGGSDAWLLEEVDPFGGPISSGASFFNKGPLPGFPGFFSANHTYRAIIGLGIRPMGGTQANILIERTFTKSDAPVFQATIFYEDDLELHPGESMYLAGPVFSNHRMYVSALNGKSLTFAGNVGANKTPNDPIPGIVYNNRNPSHSGYNEGLPPGSTYNAADYHAPDYAVAKADQLTMNQRLEPAGRGLRKEINTTDSNPNNDGFRELIEKPDTGATDPPATARARMYNQATLRVSVTQTGGVQTVNVTGYNGAILPASVVSKVQEAIGTRKAVHDKREATNVHVIPVNVAKLVEAEELYRTTTGSTESLSSILYLSDDTANPGGKWAFRLENATKLPSASVTSDAPSSQRGFTVASAGGIYFKGNYNTDTANASVPSAVMADAVMFLSNSWKDDNAANPIYGVDDGYGGTVPGSERIASETTYRAAVLAGTIPAGYDPTPAAPSSGDEYGASGGAHNFPRMLEKWTGTNMNFKGSMVQLFTSKMFTGRWQTGDVYHPPTRNWSANEDFVRRPSPGLFTFSFYSRGPWRRL